MAASAGEVASILLTQPPTANMGSTGMQGVKYYAGLGIWSSDNFDLVLLHLLHNWRPWLLWLVMVTHKFVTQCPPWPAAPYPRQAGIRSDKRSVQTDVSEPQEAETREADSQHPPTQWSTVLTTPSPCSVTC